MKSFTVLIILLFALQTSFAQRDSAMLAKCYQQDTTTFGNIVRNINQQYGLEFCDCSKNNPTMYFYRIPSMRLVQDSTGKEYPMHEIVIIEQTLRSWNATIYENFAVRTASPKSGWRTFNQVLDTIDIRTLPKNFFEIEYTVFASPDGLMTWLRTCENGSPKVYGLQGGLKFITQAGMDMAVYRRSGQQVMRVRKLLALFESEFAP